MHEKFKTKASQVMPKIRDLMKGEAVVFPIEWMETVRVQTSKCNAIMGGKRRTYIDKEEKVIYVERIN